MHKLSLALRDTSFQPTCIGNYRGEIESHVTASLHTLNICVCAFSWKNPSFSIKGAVLYFLCLPCTAENTPTLPSPCPSVRIKCFATTCDPFTNQSPTCRAGKALVGPTELREEINIKSGNLIMKVRFERHISMCFHCSFLMSA